MKSYLSIAFTIIFSTILLLQINFLFGDFFDFSFSQKEVELKFIGEDDEWIFINPGEDEKFDTDDDIHIDSDTPLYLPKNSKVSIELKSLDKLYCLEILQFDIIKMAIPGLEMTLDLDLQKQENDLIIDSGPMCGGNLDKLSKQIHLIKEKSYLKWLKKFSLAST